METKIKKSITHDSLSISGTLESGASFKWRVGRSGEKLDLAFSNDTKVLKVQAQLFQKWIKFRQGETNLDRINRLEILARKCKSGSEMCAFMEKEV